MTKRSFAKVHNGVRTDFYKQFLAGKVRTGETCDSIGFKLGVNSSIIREVIHRGMSNHTTLRVIFGIAELLGVEDKYILEPGVTRGHIMRNNKTF